MKKLTKIVATIGPSSRKPETIIEFIKNGVNVFRLNFSHGSHEEHLLSVKYIREASEKLNISVAILQDLQGPKIRVGQIKDGSIELTDNQQFIITTEKITGDYINSIPTVSIDHSNLHNEIDKDTRILLDDGLMEVVVQKIEEKKMHTLVINGGILKSHKGVNIPNKKLNISTLTDKDRNDLKFSFENNIDFIALSFVRDAEDVLELKDLMRSKFNSTIPIIAKIEKPEAYADIDRILEVSDAIMVARGDLGVETSPQEVPIIQKSIIRKCNIAGKPIITATQMLESMINNPRPTRAEANDVANAILDNTDAIMLSGETAAGNYPIEAVKMMNDIAIQVESSSMYKDSLQQCFHNHNEVMQTTSQNIEGAVSFATTELADKIGAKYIVTFTYSGGTAKKISKFRSETPVIAFSPVISTVRQLNLAWGITPIQIGNYSSVKHLLEGAEELLKLKKLANKEDIIVFTAGIPVGIPGSTNMIKVIKL